MIIELVRKTGSTNFNSPKATSWIPYTKGDTVPTGRILIALLEQPDEEVEGGVARSPVSCEFYEGLNTFLDNDFVVLELTGTVTHYHILHWPDGELALLS